MSRSSSLIKNTALLTVSKLATQVVAFILVPLYTFHLPAEDYGRIDLVMTYIALLAPLLSIQLEFAAFRFAIDTRGDRIEMGNVLMTILSMIIPVVLIIVMVSFLLGVFMHIPYITLVSLNIVIAILSSVLLQFARGIGDIKRFTIASIAIGVANSLLCFLFIVLLKWPAESLMIALALANLIGLIYIGQSIVRGIGSRATLRSVDQRLRLDMLRYSIPLLPNSIAWWILNVSDRTIITWFIGAAANGIYAIASKFAFIPGIIFGIFNMSWSESASIHINSADRDSFFSKVSDMSLRLYVFVTVIYLLLIDILYPYIIGSEYLDSRLLIPILAAGALFQSILGNYSAVYIAKKKTKEIATSSVVAAVINILINLCLIKIIGIYAAAVSTAIAFAIMAAIRHFHIQRYVIIQYRTPNLVGSFLLLAASFGLYYLDFPVHIGIILYGLTLLIGLYLNIDTARFVVERVRKITK